MTNLVQFPGLGLSFELDRVAFSIGGADIYWYGVCIAFGLCLALVFAFRRCTEFGPFISFFRRSIILFSSLDM